MSKSTFDYPYDEDKWRNPYAMNDADFEAKMRVRDDEERSRLCAEAKLVPKPKHEELWDIYKLAEDLHSRLAAHYKQELHFAVEEDYFDIAHSQIRDKPIGDSSLKELAKALIDTGDLLARLDEMQSQAKRDQVPF